MIERNLTGIEYAKRLAELCEGDDLSPEQAERLASRLAQLRGEFAKKCFTAAELPNEKRHIAMPCAFRAVVNSCGTLSGTKLGDAIQRAHFPHPQRHGKRGPGSY